VISGWDKKNTPISPVVASKCEDVLARSDACCEMLAGLARELGNLLTVVSGWAQCLQEAKASEREAVARCVHAGLGRIRYSLNRLGSGRSTGRLAVMDANRLIASVLRGLDPRVRSGFALYVVEQPDPWPLIADAWALDLVLINLVMNAVAASEPGSPIVIETANFQSEAAVDGVDGSVTAGCYASISIRDFGGGMAEGGLGDGLLPAAPVASSPDPELGFPISLGILQEHAGLLQLTRSPDGETTARVLLPALLARKDVSGQGQMDGDQMDRDQMDGENRK
jgi:nitrogen-specific signal transduction histidine kinase